MCVFLNTHIYYFWMLVLEMLVYSLILWWVGIRIIVMLTWDQNRSESTEGKEEFAAAESSAYYTKGLSH